MDEAISSMLLQLIVGLSSVSGSLALFYVTGKLIRYLSAALSANIYENGIIYPYRQDFDEDEHTHFSPLSRGREQGCLSSREELNVLRCFIRNRVIPAFRHHHDEIHGGNHFATLILLDRPLESLSEDWVFRPLSQNGRPYIDPRYQTRPPCHLYGNYVVARPQLHRVPAVLRALTFQRVPEIFYEHAEEMLVNEFDFLRESFEANGNRISVIVVFSWLFPCDRCTSLAIEKFGLEFRQRHSNIQRVILTFAIFWRRMSFDENWKNFERLKRNGFDVVRVNCNGLLPD